MKWFVGPEIGTVWTSSGFMLPVLYVDNADCDLHNFDSYATTNFLILSQHEAEGSVRVLCNGHLYLVDRNWWCPNISGNIHLTRLI